MQTLDVIKKRRSVRSFTDRAVEENKLEKLVEAAIWAPSGGNRQPWNVVIVQPKEDIEQIRAVSPGILGNPGALIVLCADRTKTGGNEEEAGSGIGLYKRYQNVDIGIAAQNICLEATELGLGSCMVGSFNQKAVTELLDIPDRFIPELVVSLGYPQNMPDAPPRRTVKETVIRWIKPGDEK